MVVCIQIFVSTSTLRDQWTLENPFKEVFKKESLYLFFYPPWELQFYVEELRQLFIRHVDNMAGRLSSELQSRM